MNVVVFLGPTLPAAEARAILDADYRPPAAMGDVFAAVERSRPDAIGVIDGYFNSVPSIWHKEILFALSRGVAVFGAASMGALRAAELAPFGMTGIGWVFEQFHSGALEDDDEVAIVHSDDDTYRPLSTAMVTLRAALLLCRSRGLLTADTCAALLDLAKRCYYPDRSWPRLLRDAAAAGIDAEALERVRRFVAENRPDVKADDARALLTHLAGLGPDRPAPSAAEFTRTIFWDKLAADERRLGASAASSARGDVLRRFTKATDPDLPALLRTGLLLHLVERECDALGIDVGERELEAAQRSFRLERRLLTAEALRAWREEAGLSVDEFRSLLHLEARVLALLEVYATPVDALLPEALALRGSLARTLLRGHAVESGSHDQAAAPDEPTSEELEQFYRTRVRTFAGPLQRHARELGFQSAVDLLREVRKVYARTGGATAQDPSPGKEEPCA